VHRRNYSRKNWLCSTDSEAAKWEQLMSCLGGLRLMSSSSSSSSAAAPAAAELPSMIV